MSSINSDFSVIRYEESDGVAKITIDRPEVLNALNNEAHVELGQAFDHFEASDTLRVAIITGAGERAFCTGNDLKAASAGEPLMPETWSGGFGGLVKRFGMSKPVIAAVNGWAAGGGFEIALACDLIIAAENARFALPEVRRGRIAAAGGVHRLPRKLPVTVAMGMLLTGRDMDAATAERWGVVNELTTPETLMETAERWACQILQCAPLAVGVTKEAVIGGLDMSLADAIDWKPKSYARWMNSGERNEGAIAFVEKRKPRWAEH